MADFVLVSACLFGIPCRYDGRHSLRKDLVRKLSRYQVILFCPEVAGGLKIPRPIAWLEGGDGEKVIWGGGKVINAEGKDVTKEFFKGGEQAAEAAKKFAVRTAYLKEKSPSCGVKMTSGKEGHFEGSGIASFLLKAQGIKLIGID
jgi:uncharacterized protein YbbK (DUF523 family)